MVTLLPSLIFVASALAFFFALLSWLDFKIVTRRRDPPKARFGLVQVLTPSQSNGSPESSNGTLRPSNDCVDVIFVHGLGANPDTTWTGVKRSGKDGTSRADSVSKVNWIQDFLAPDVATKLGHKPRLFYYNYDSYWQRDSAEHRLIQLADEMLRHISQVLSLEKRGSSRRLVFVGHSFGGLVIKQALVRAKVSKSYYDIAGLTAGVVFLGTPHRGFGLTALARLRARLLWVLGSSTSILQGLDYDSLMLKDLQSDFFRSFYSKRFVNIYERFKTRTFQLGGFYWDQLVVDERSATFDMVHGDNVGVLSDHSGLNKFASRNDQYWDVVAAVGDILREPSSGTALRDSRNSSPGTHLSLPAQGRIDNSEHLLRDEQLSQRSAILQWISSEPYLQHQEHLRSLAHPGTGSWIFNHTAFQTWLSQDESKILWVNGCPGSGKSVLASLIIDDARKRSQAGNSSPPVFFYCSHRSSARSNAEDILASLVRQLCMMHNEVPQRLMDLYSERQAEGFALGKLRIQETQRLILQLLQQSLPSFILIDGIDECGDQAQIDLLSCIQEISEIMPFSLKILLMSRPYIQIDFQLEGCAYIKVNSFQNGHDIETFVRSETDRLIREKKLLRYSKAQQELRDLIIDSLVRRADGMFLWVRSVLREIASTIVDADIHDRLNSIPASLEDLYRHMLVSRQAQFGEHERGVQTAALHRLVQADETAKTARFLEDISLSLNMGSKALSKEQILAICNGFVIWDDASDTLQLIHWTSREFLKRHLVYTLEHK